MKNPLTKTTALFALVPVVQLLACASAFAQQTPAGVSGAAAADTGYAANANPADAGTAAYVRQWKGMVGLAVGSKPEYPGARDNEATVAPIGRLTYDRYFIGAVAGIGPGVGAYLYRDRNFSASLGLAHNLGDIRKESDNARLQGLGDIKGTTWAGVGGEYRNDWLKAELGIASDIGGKDLGTLATLSVMGVYRPTSRLELSAGPRVVYGSGNYLRTVYGVDAAQSGASGLAGYRPKAGVVENALDLGASYQLSQQWVIGARASLARLAGDAADSPIVEKKAQNRAGVYLGYRF